MAKNFKQVGVFTAITVIFLVVAVLVGCASPAPSQVPTQSPEPTSSPTPATTPTQTSSPAPQPAAKKLVLSLAATVPDSDWKTVACQQLADEVKKRTNGEVEIQVFPNGQLIKDKDMATAMPAGTADLAEAQVGSFSGLVPEAAILDMFMYYENPKHWWTTAEGKLGEVIAQKLETKANIKFLSWMSNAPGDGWITTTKTIKEPADMKGLKFRTQASPPYVKAIDALGGTGSVISATELYTALQTGTVQAAFSSPRAVIEYKWYEITPYISRLTFVAEATFAFLANKDAWNRIPANYQKIIMDVAKEQGKWTLEYGAKQHEEYWKQIADLKASGKIKDFYVVPPETAKKFIAIVAPSQKELILQNKSITNAQELLDLVEQARPK